MQSKLRFSIVHAFLYPFDKVNPEAKLSNEYLSSIGDSLEEAQERLKVKIVVEPGASTLDTLRFQDGVYTPAVLDLSDKEAAVIGYGIRKITRYSYAFALKLRGFIKDPYPGYSVSVISQYLTQKTSLKYPLTAKENGTSRADRQRILNFYTLSGYDIVYPDTVYNNDQEDVLSIKEGVWVVNAGPGTGKTTTANERAWRYRDTKVLLVSYTNQAIKENAKRLQGYLDSNKYVCMRSYTKNITISTVDSLAAKISWGKDGNWKGGYDKSVDGATSILKRGQRGKLGDIDHIIVDEAQDIDDRRGELLLLLYNTIGCKSMVIFGDPRQRLFSDRGGWFSKLFNNKDQVKGLTHSYRFETQGVLDVVNSLSERRGNLHCALVGDIKDTSPAVFCLQSEGFGVYQAVSDRIKALVDSGTRLDNICIISVSDKKINAASSSLKKLIAHLLASGISCTGNAGTFHTYGVGVSNIHNVKGKEYDHVFLIGFNSFPTYHSMIPYESAESMIFVSMSRARKSITFVSQDPRFIVPRGLTPAMVASTCVREYTWEYRLPKLEPLSISDISVDGDLGLYMHFNNQELDIKEVAKLSLQLPCPKDVNPVYWGALCGLAVQIHMYNDLPDTVHLLLKHNVETLSERDYKNAVRCGDISMGIRLSTMTVVVIRDSVNSPTDEEIEKLKNMKPESMTNEDYHLVLQIMEYISSGSMHYRYHPVPKDICIKDSAVGIAEEITSIHGECTSIEEPVLGVSKFYIGRADAICGKRIIEIKAGNSDIVKQAAVQVYLYHMCYPQDTTMHVCNISDGKVYSVSYRFPKCIMERQLRHFAAIKYHQDTVVRMSNSRLAKGYDTPPPIGPNTFYVDTEFMDKDICELSVYNAHTPYRSISRTIKVPPQAARWAADWLSLPESIFRESAKLEEVVSMIRYSLVPDTPATFYYYNAKIDVSWAEQDTKIDLAGIITKGSTRYGYKPVGTSTMPKLEDMYYTLAGAAEVNRHVVPHWSMSDAIMLHFCHMFI